MNAIVRSSRTRPAGARAFLAGLAVVGLTIAATAAVAAGPAPAPATKIYRCGNVFQDRPCTADSSETAKPAERASAPSATAKSGADAAAKDRLAAEPAQVSVAQAKR